MQDVEVVDWRGSGEQRDDSVAIAAAKETDVVVVEERMRAL
jgi:hypothetical protein